MNTRTPVDVEALRGHTDGPWQYDAREGIVRTVETEWPLAEMWQGCGAHNNNGNLFAAAPDLLAEVISRRSRDAAVAELVEALESIAEHEGRDVDGGFVDEWSEAAAFTECQNIAKAALSAYRGGAPE